MNIELIDWNVEDHLKTPEDRAAYINAAIEEGTADALPDAFADVFRSIGKFTEAAICDGIAATLRAANTGATPAPQAARHRAKAKAMRDDDIG